jgi:hypothetical protein
VKDGDNIEITAGITGSTTLNLEDMTADLSGLGLGTSVVADSFDGFTATWTLNNVECNPSDGTITVTVYASDIDSNSATIIADNTNPEITIEKPVNGLYLFNTKILPISRTIIIGSIDIELDLDDLGGIDTVEFYIDDELEMTTYNEPFDWHMNKRTIGQHELKFIVYDNAGNSNSNSHMVKLYILFGN